MAQQDFYRKGVDTEGVIGGPARILVADPTVMSYPTQMSEVIDFSTYQPMAGWIDVGHTSEPFESTNSFDTTDWISQQIGRINIQVGTWTRTISVTFMESRNQKVMDLVHQVDSRETNGAGELVTYFVDAADVSEWRMVAMHLDAKSDRITMDVFPRIKRSGADATTAWDRENPQTHGTEFSPLPDPDMDQQANWYRLEEPVGG